MILSAIFTLDCQVYGNKNSSLGSDTKDVERTPTHILHSALISFPETQTFCTVWDCVLGTRVLDASWTAVVVEHCTIHFGIVRWALHSLPRRPSFFLQRRTIREQRNGSSISCEAEGALPRPAEEGSCRAGSTGGRCCKWEGVLLFFLILWALLRGWVWLSIHDCTGIKLVFKLSSTPELVNLVPSLHLVPSADWEWG